MTLIVATAATLITPTPGGADTPNLWIEAGPTDVRLSGVDITPSGDIAFAVNDLGEESFLENLPIGRVWRTTDRGTTWQKVETSPMGAWLAVAITADASTVVIVGQLNSGTGASPMLSNAVYVSTDSAATWVDITPDTSVTYADVDVTADGSVIAIASSAGVLTSSDIGENWGVHRTLPGSPDVIAMGEDQTSPIIHAGYANSIVSARLGDETASSKLITGVLTDVATSSDGRIVIAGSYDPGETHLSIDGGTTWTTTSQRLFSPNQKVSVGVSGDGTTFAATAYNSPLVRSALVNASVSGMTWSEFDSARNWLGLAMSSDGGVVVGVMEATGIRTWVPMPPPVVVSAWPASLPTSGGTTLLISGQYLFDVESITIGGRPATSIQAAGNSVAAVVPAGHPVGPADIVVTTAYGTATLSAQVSFYQPGPVTITSISASGGPYRGGQTVTVSGSGFLELSSLHIGDRQVDVVSTPNDNTLTFVTPPNRIGLMDIRWESARGSLTIRNGWNSQWVSTSGAPRWSSLDGTVDSSNWFGTVTSLAEGPDGSIYVAGDFGNVAGIRAANGIVRWDGASWSALGNDGTGGPALSPGGSMGVYGINGVLDLAIDDNGGVWAGGAFNTEFGDRVEDANLARWDPSTNLWTVPDATPDGVVEALEWAPGVGLYVGGEFHDVAGIAAADAVALLDDGVWSALGSNVTGDGVIASAGALSPYWSSPVPRVLALAATSQQLLVGGSFVAPAVTMSNALLRWDPAQAEWYPGVDSTLPGPVSTLPAPVVVTDLAVGEVGGSEAAVAALCLLDPGGSTFGVALLIGPSYTGPLGGFDDCILDVEIVAGHPVVGGWFSRGRSVSDAFDVPVEGAAVLTAEGWVDLGVDTEVYSLLVLEDGRLVVGGPSFDQIGGAPGARGLGISTSLLPLLGKAVSVSATGASPATPYTSAGQTITITGSGFTRETEVTYGGYPAPNVRFVSANELRFTTRAVPAGPTPITVYGDVDTSTVTVSAVAPPPPPPPGDGSAPGGSGTADDTGTTVPTTEPGTDDTAVDTTRPDAEEPTVGGLRAPTVEQIGRLPLGSLVGPGTRLVAGSLVRVGAAGFAPGEEVVVAIASTPRVIGTGAADAAGRVSLSVTLPVDLSGTHTLVVWSPTTGHGVRQRITINTAQLPATGGGFPTWPAASMLLLGMVAVLTARRRELRIHH